MSDEEKSAFLKRALSISDLSETSNKGRLEIWLATFPSIFKHPFLGVGAGNFPVILEQSHAASKMGYSKGILARTEMPPDVIEDTCPLCGHFMPLEDNGYCATDECKENARDAIRRMVRENGGVWEQTHTLDLTSGGAAPLSVDLAVKYPALTDVVARKLDASSGSMSGTAQFFGVLVDD